MNISYFRFKFQRMAKRFTDTTKWRKPFMRNMSAPYKLLWLYICDDCDHAGIWQVDWEVAQIYIGEALDYEKAVEIFAGRVIPFDENTKWFIPSFLEFQYPGELNEKNKVHNSVISTLNKYGLIQGAYKGHTRGIQAPKDKEQDKEKEKDKDKGGIRGDEVFEVGGIKPGINDLGMDIPELKTGSIIQFFSAAQQIALSHDQVKSMWEAFKAQYFTGVKYYKSIEDIYSHFINWARQQKIKDGNTKPGTGQKNNRKPTGGELQAQKLAASLQRLNGGGS